MNFASTELFEKLSAKARRRPLRVGVLGATGAVGQEMLRCLAQREAALGRPLFTLRLFAGNGGDGRSLSYGGRMIPVENLSSEEDGRSFAGLDVCLGAVSRSLAVRYAPLLLSQGVLFIDNSSAFRLEETVPLVVPWLNPSAIEGCHGILSSANCSTIITLTAVAPLIRAFGGEKLIVSTYQAVSGSGKRGFAALEEETAALAQGKPLSPSDTSPYDYPIAGNLIPKIGSAPDGGETDEERKLREESRKILSLPDLSVSCTCVRVPVARCHAMSVYLRTATPLTAECVRETLRLASAARPLLAPGHLLLTDEREDLLPMPLLVEHSSAVALGRLRMDPDDPFALSLFCCADQLRVGAADSTVELLMTVLRAVTADGSAAV